ncbi:MAG: hypothetical protein FJZ01_25215 [Candidatus Sericytochromatia bacterium]|nr:hypothetical protein [Candidatus Tanganyikabacteria bacterium]
MLGWRQKRGRRIVWFDIQANPERVTTVGNAALVVPGAVEIEGGGELALSNRIAVWTPIRVKVGAYDNLQVSFNTEGFLVRQDLQRPAGVGLGLKLPLHGDHESPLPFVAARLDIWSPLPAPMDGVARAQAEIVASRTWGNFGFAAAAGGDFAANGASGPMGGLALGIPELGPVGAWVEARYRSGLFYGGASAAYTISREAVVDLGGGYRSDGALLVRTGFTRSFALPW